MEAKHLQRIAAALLFSTAVGIVLFSVGDGEPSRGAARVIEPAPEPVAAESRGMVDPSAPKRMPADTPRKSNGHIANPSDAPLPDAPASTGPADLDATQALLLRVLDPAGLPLLDASVRVEGMSAADGTWSAAGPVLEAHTDGQGRARLEYREWINRDHRAEKLMLGVRHPDFVPCTRYDIEPDSAEQVIVLARGGTVVVSGWIGSPERRVADLVVRTDSESDLTSADWERLPDGRFLTHRLQPGPHCVQLRFEHPDLGLHWSAIHRFEVALVHEQVLHLELLPAERLVGQLDAAVPRPVQRGEAVLVLTTEAGVGPYTSTSHTAAIEPDGTFVFEALPPGSGYWLARADGWISQLAPASNLAELGREFDGTAAEHSERLAALGELALVPQQIEVPQLTTPAVLAMNAGGDLEVTLLDDAGRPLSGATIMAWPNYSIQSLVWSTYPGGGWQAQTGVDGRATLRGLPPDADLWYGVSHPRFQLGLLDGDRDRTARIHSGEVTAVRLQLERKP